MNNISIPSIELPQGGGAVGCIDEKFTANPSKGTSSLSVSVPVAGARGFVPGLAVQYDSGNGNGIFGIGWKLNLKCISRKTDTAIPRYRDDEESDVFLLSGLEDLVPAGEPYADGSIQYRPRTEGSFMLIQRMPSPDGKFYWKITDRSNTVTVYGLHSDSRLTSPNGDRIYQWYPEFSYDCLGNAIEYIYSHESLSDIDITRACNRNRIKDGILQCSGIYLMEARYGNTKPYHPGEERPEEYRFIIKLNYSQKRRDALSSYRAGFEVRTSRLCTSILNIHRFPALPGGEATVSSLDFEYESGETFTLLHSISKKGYIKHQDGNCSVKSMPPTVFSYTKSSPSSSFKKVDVEYGRDFIFTDLYNEGIPGLLSEHNSNWYYRRNLGDGNFSAPLAVPVRPSMSGLVLMDMESDGNKELVSLSFEPRGFFELTPNGSWSAMHYFQNLPMSQINASECRMIDLTGDGRPDILLAGDEVFTWYESEGKKGYSTGDRVSFPSDEELGARVSFNDAEQSVFLADMSGDGLSDIVRVRNGEVCWWPNLGYGRFGAKITMDNSPVFAEEVLFNPQMIRFADIDGSGTSDIIYLGNGKLQYWLNSCGTGFSEQAYTVEGMPDISPGTRFDFVDLLGNGTSCVVCSSPYNARGDRRMMYADLTAGIKPYIMEGYVTGNGKSVSFHYKSSVKYYLEDMLDGKIWPRKLPFPVQCLSRVETKDMVTGHLYVCEYAYHEGHYDHAEKEFRGFGLVEQTDTEQTDSWKNTGDATNWEKLELCQKPVLTRIWFSTGLAESSCGIEVPSGLDDRSWREAYRAARGAVLRQTVSDYDGRLYSETVSSMKVLLVQETSTHSIFLPLPGESLTKAFEGGDHDDPRISQVINLKYDEVGNLLDSVSIAYPRLKKDDSLPEEISGMQKECHIVLNCTRYTNDIIDADNHFLRLPYLNESYVLENVPKKADYYSAEDFIGNPGESFLGSRSLTLFYSGDMKTPSAEGKIESVPAFAYGSYTQAFTDDVLLSVYGDDITSDDMRKALYCKLNGYPDVWWIPSGRAVLLGEGETDEELRRRFYTILEYENVRGGRSRVHYVNDECLMLDSAEDVLGNATAALEHDYRTLSPVKVEDANGNQSSVVTDELGMVMAAAVMGKGNEADTLDGFSDTTSSDDAALVERFFDTSDYATLESLARQLLRGATSRHIYKLDSTPVCTATITREQHNAVNPNSPLIISFAYTGGLGSVVMTKVQAETSDGSDNVRWLGNGRTVFNNKGKVIMQYEPYFSNTPVYEESSELMEKGVTAIHHYDALGREIKIEYPDGTFSKSEFDAWKSAAYDCIDTVNESSWMTLRQQEGTSSLERQAADKSAALADTPYMTHYDSLGRGVYALACDGMHSITFFNRFGFARKVVDSRGNTVVEYEHNLLGTPVSVRGMDSGFRRELKYADGGLYLRWDARRHRTELTYDIAGRPLSERVTGGEDEVLDNIVTRIVYAEELLAKGEEKDLLRSKNCLGRAVSRYDTAGKTDILRYDLAGRAIESRFRTAKEYKGTVNWTTDGINEGLDEEEFVTSNEYDALGRTVKTVEPDKSEISVEYGRGGLPKSQSVRRSTEKAAKKYIKSLVYNEKRQRLSIVYGNGVSVKYFYDPLTFRLYRILATRKNGKTVQDLNYTFDAAGNITHITDNAVPVEFNSNNMISGDSDYTYDSNYRLICATGRENAAALRTSGPDEYNDSGFCGIYGNGDPVGLRNYTEKYVYDNAGNILQMKHFAQGNNWTRDYEYAEGNNRLLKTTIGDTVSCYEYHPEHGFLTSMPHMSALKWNFRDELSMSSRQFVGEGKTGECTYYCYDASGQRIRKVTVNGKSANGKDIIKDERIYLGDYEVYRCHSGVHSGTERITISLCDSGSHRYLLLEDNLERYQLDNVIGSSAIELNEDAAVISNEEYHPYGTTAWQTASREIKNAGKRYRYTGMERDEESGLNYHTARYYIPWLGRWLSPDPIGIDGGLNFYCYCGCNPVSRTDIAGTDWWNRTLGGLQMVAGVAEGVVAAGLASVAAGAAVTGIGTPLAVVAGAGAAFLGARAVDDTYTGGKNLIFDKSDDTLLADAVEYYAEAGGMDHDDADLLGKGVDLGVGVGTFFVPGAGIVKLPAAAEKGTRIAQATDYALYTAAKTTETVSETVEGGTRIARLSDYTFNTAAEAAEDGTRIASLSDYTLYSSAKTAETASETVEGGTRIAQLSDYALYPSTKTAETVSETVEEGTRIARLSDYTFNTTASAAEEGTRIAQLSDYALYPSTKTAEMVSETVEEGTRIAQLSDYTFNTAASAAEEGTRIAQLSDYTLYTAANTAEDGTRIAQLSDYMLYTPAKAADTVAAPAVQAAGTAAKATAPAITAQKAWDTGTALNSSFLTGYSAGNTMYSAYTNYYVNR